MSINRIERRRSAGASRPVHPDRYTAQNIYDPVNSDPDFSNLCRNNSHSFATSTLNRASNLSLFVSGPNNLVIRTIHYFVS